MSRIGVFDSGFGGLSVLYEAMQRLPGQDFIYYADRVHVPYGEKSQEQLLEYVQQVVDFLINQNVDTIVIACNTATSVAVASLREQYTLPIIGMEPAVKKALDLYGDKKVLVTATPITVRGDKMKLLVDRVDKHHLVDLVALPGLVHFAEREQFDKETVVPYLQETLQDRDLTAYSSLVLGCTHFNYFKDSFRDILPEQMALVDGNAGTISQLIRKLGTQIESTGEGRTVYYDSGKLCEGEKREKIDRYLERVKRMREIS